MVKEKDSENVAEHELLNAAGESPDDLTEEEAVGYRYTLQGNKRDVTVMWDDLTPAIQRAAGLFGIKTRFTNDTSGVRNKVKGRDGDGKVIKPYQLDFDQQIQAVIDTVEDWKKGTWLDRTREAGAPRVNKDALAQAICQNFVGDGKFAESDIGTAGSGGKYDHYRARLDSDPAYMAMARAHVKVADYYNAIVGKPRATTDDLL